MSTDIEEVKRLAAQLRKPEGEPGVKIGQVMNEGNRPMNLHTLAVLDVKKNDRILEIGMGNGCFVHHILSFDESIVYTGCDYSELMVSESILFNKRYIETGRATFVQANAQELPFSNASFTKVFTVNTLYFWDNIPVVFQELKRVLTTDGELCISIRPKHNLEQYPVSEFGFTKYTKEEFVALLHANGFSKIEITEVKEPSHEVFGQTFERESLILKVKI